MITRLGTCHNYYNDTGRASSLPFRGAPEDTARCRALGAALQRAVARGSSFFHSFVHQIHTDILAPDSVLSPGGVHATVGETGKSITSFQFCERGFSGQGSLRNARCAMDPRDGLAKVSKLRGPPVMFAASQAAPRPGRVNHQLSDL